MQITGRARGLRACFRSRDLRAFCNLYIWSLARNRRALPGFEDWRASRARSQGCAKQVTTFLDRTILSRQ